MNIRDAKKEIKEALRAYFKKDDCGVYRYPLLRQRPILLMGPPGIGKTAIMEQIAKEQGVGLVSYTMTHHTRQSAIGLPQIIQRKFGDQTFAVTEYTLSEIITSVYECMERTGHREGILFLDEINCVSETLAPVMLQFLQNKQFGNHKVPEGWLIVAAGNPEKYNKSVRTFDIVTLDRVRKIEVDADLGCWMDYAINASIHGAILSYLKLKPERFYSIHLEGETCRFVTARGWEDLSRLLFSYEEDELQVEEALICQFLQDGSAASEFAAYYRVYNAMGSDFQAHKLLGADASKCNAEEIMEQVNRGSMETRFAFVGQLLDVLGMQFRTYAQDAEFLKGLTDEIEHMRTKQGSWEENILQREETLQQEIRSNLITWEEARRMRRILHTLREIDVDYRIHLGQGEKDAPRLFEQRLSGLREKMQDRADQIGDMLDRAFWCMERIRDGNGEMFLFVSLIARMKTAAAFLNTHRNEAFLKHCSCLVADQTPEELIAQL